MPAGAIITLYLFGAAATVAVVKLLVNFTTAEDTKPRTNLKQPIPAELLRALVIHSQWVYITGRGAMASHSFVPRSSYWWDLVQHFRVWHWH
jgi:hypothetical protein